MGRKKVPTVLTFDSEFKKEFTPYPHKLVERIRNRPSRRRPTNLIAAEERKKAVLRAKQFRAKEDNERLRHITRMNELRQTAAKKAFEHKLVMAHKKKALRTLAISCRAGKHNEEAKRVQLYVHRRDKAIAQQIKLRSLSKQAVASINRQQLMNERIMRIALNLAECRVKAMNSKMTSRERADRLEADMKRSLDAAMYRRDALMDERTFLHYNPAHDARSTLTKAGQAVNRVRLGMEIETSLAAAEARRTAKLEESRFALRKRHDFVSRRARRQSLKASYDSQELGLFLDAKMEEAHRRHRAALEAKKKAAAKEVEKAMSKHDEEERKRLEEAKKLKHSIEDSLEGARRRRDQHLKNVQVNASVMTDLMHKQHSRQSIAV